MHNSDIFFRKIRKILFSVEEYMNILFYKMSTFLRRVLFGKRGLFPVVEDLKVSCNPRGSRNTFSVICYTKDSKNISQQA